MKKRKPRSSKNARVSGRLGRTENHIRSRKIYFDPHWEESFLTFGGIWPRVLEERRDIPVMDSVHVEFLGQVDELILDGEHACRVLQQMLDAILQASKRIGGQQTYHRWLQNLRYVPSIIYGAGQYESASSFRPRREWTEMLAAATAAPASTMLHPDMAQKVVLHEHDYLPILHFIRMGLSYASLQILMNCANKNVPIRFRRGKMPYIVKESDGWRAVKALDLRRDAVGSRGVMDTVAGTAAISLDTINEPPPSLLAYGLSALPNDDGLPVRPELTEATGVKGVQYVYHPIETRVPWLMADLEWYSKRLPLRCFAATALAYYATAMNPWFSVGLQLFGQITIRKSDLVQIFENWRESPHAKSLYATFPGLPYPYTDEQLLPALTWEADLANGPPPPAMTEVGGGFVMLDLIALTNRILLDLRLEKSPPVTERRARHFEREAQKLVDASPWAPQAIHRKHVHKDLRRADGTKLTDVDTLAEKGGVALFINCKSYITDAWGRGSGREVRNTRDRLTRDYADWQEKVKEIETQPEGPNYDFRGIREFVPVLVTPGPCLVDPTLLDPRSANIPPVVSIYELEKFIVDE